MIYHGYPILLLLVSWEMEIVGWQIGAEDGKQNGYLFVQIVEIGYAKTISTSTANPIH